MSGADRRDSRDGAVGATLRVGRKPLGHQPPLIAACARGRHCARSRPTRYASRGPAARRTHGRTTARGSPGARHGGALRRRGEWQDGAYAAAGGKEGLAVMRRGPDARVLACGAAARRRAVLLSAQSSAGGPIGSTPRPHYGSTTGSRASTRARRESESARSEAGPPIRPRSWRRPETDARQRRDAVPPRANHLSGAAHFRSVAALHREPGRATGGARHQVVEREQDGRAGCARSTSIPHRLSVVRAKKDAAHGATAGSPSERDGDARRRSRQRYYGVWPTPVATS